MTAGDTTTIIRTAAPATLDPALAVSDPDGNWAGSTLTFQITGNADPGDTLSLPTTSGSLIWVDGTSVMEGQVQLGTVATVSVTGGAADSVVLAATTNDAVTALADAVQISVAAGASLANRTVTITATDSDGASSAGTDTIMVSREPALTGGGVQPVSDAASVAPLGGLTISDGTAEGLTVSVAFDPTLGSFSATGWTVTASAGVSTLTKDFPSTTAPGDATAALAALRFVPVAHAGAVGTTQDVAFTVTATGDTTGLIATDGSAAARDHLRQHPADPHRERLGGQLRSRQASGRARSRPAGHRSRRCRCRQLGWWHIGHRHPERRRYRARPALPGRFRHHRQRHHRQHRRHPDRHHCPPARMAALARR